MPPSTGGKRPKFWKQQHTAGHRGNFSKLVWFLLPGAPMDMKNFESPKQAKQQRTEKQSLGLPGGVFGIGFWCACFTFVYQNSKSIPHNSSIKSSLACCRACSGGLRPGSLGVCGFHVWHLMARRSARTQGPLMNLNMERAETSTPETQTAPGIKTT